MSILEWVRSHHGKSAIGIPAPASTLEFLVRILSQNYQLDFTAVPYRGGAPLINDMLGNQIAAGTASVPDLIENHRAGKVRIVAVLGKHRQEALPEVPTFSELGLAGLEDLPYYGVFAPAGTSKEFIERFGLAIHQVLQLPDVRERLRQMGLNAEFMTALQLGQREQAYTQAWAEIFRRSGFKTQP